MPGELNLATRPLTDAFEMLEHRRRQHVTPDDGEIRRRVGRLRLLDDATDAGDVPRRSVGRHDAVVVRFAPRHLLHADQAARRLQKAVAHLRQHRLRGVDQVVSEMHEEGFVADHRLRA